MACLFGELREPRGITCHRKFHKPPTIDCSSRARETAIKCGLIGSALRVVMVIVIEQGKNAGLFSLPIPLVQLPSRKNERCINKSTDLNG